MREGRFTRLSHSDNKKECIKWTQFFFKGHARG
jgi:hypothetical protein